jgi:hypothetical protein
MAEGDDFERRLLLSVDAKGYGSGTDRRHGIVQETLLKVLDDAAERAGLVRAAWQRQPAGDGELAVLPRGEREPRVADDFVRHLVTALRRNNRDGTPEQRLRLRLALHFGPTMPAANGFKGSGPVVVSRLCGCGPLRAALVASGADLAVVLSKQVFGDTIVQEHTSLDQADFRQVRVRDKEYDDDAWILVPGHDVHALELPTDDGWALHTDGQGSVAAGGTPGGKTTPVSAGHKSVHNVFNDEVDARGAVFGFNEK